MTHVMTASSIPAARGGGYARYLEGKTVAPERGDYYLTPDGEMIQAPGRWLAEPDTLEPLGVKPDEPVAGEDFVALMEGRHPGTGRWLRPTGAGGGRGGGIDVTFSAPKSVSVAWALSDPWQRERIEAAHARAVEQAMLYMREHVPLVRRRQNGPVVEEQAKDLIAAEYRHTTARGVSGAQAPDPQLHSHVVITAVVREDERVVAVASRPVFRSARKLVRSTAPRSPMVSFVRGMRSSRAPARTAAISRSPAYPKGWSRSSPSARARSPMPPSDSEPDTGGRRNVESCATSHWRTVAQSS
jgi:TrwC relaxase